jgi:hypothetical protein
VARRTGILLVLALLVAGCGVRNGKPYTAKASVACFKAAGYTGISTNRVKVGFIAGFAQNGGLTARSPDGNQLTIAFTASPGDVVGTAAAFKRHAPAALRKHLADILETQKNAVLVWTTSPTADELSGAMNCLHS